MGYGGMPGYGIPGPWYPPYTSWNGMGDAGYGGMGASFTPLGLPHGRQATSVSNTFTSPLLAAGATTAAAPVAQKAQPTAPFPTKAQTGLLPTGPETSTEDA